MDMEILIAVVIMFSCLTIMIILSLWSARKLNRLKKKLLTVQARLAERRKDCS